MLRESCTIDNELSFRNLFDLGTDPSFFIKYAGGNAFYFDEIMEDALLKAGVIYDSDELEDLFWPWIKPDIKRAIDTFRSRSSNCRSKKLTSIEKDQILLNVHSFDKRRAHYLKFGTMDQGPVENMPAVLFKHLVNQSRDELEQSFLKQESTLKAHELKSYVYTVFNLQSFFSGMLAKRMPHALDQEKVDAHFIAEICRLNGSLFQERSFLDDYMIRYVIMFFDYAYANTTVLDDFARAFMSRQRFSRPRPQKPFSTRTACKIFKLNRTELAVLTKKQLTRLYRKLARQVHPDTGGSHKEFVELNLAYESLLEKIK